MRIWDLHTHLTGFGGQEPLSGEKPQQRINQLIEYGLRMGIERVVVYLGFPEHHANPTPAQVRYANDQVMAAVRHRPDHALGFTYLNPNYPAFCLEELERCIHRGPMVGVKLWIAKRCNAPELDPIVQRAHALRGAIFQHTWFKVGGNTPGESTPLDLVELAARNPGIPLICGHAGGDWELGIRAIRSSKNISLGIAGSDPTSGMVDMAVRELGAERIIWGSDAAGRSFASQLAKVHGTDIPDSEKELIFSGNLRRMLLPILEAKGIRA